MGIPVVSEIFDGFRWIVSEFFSKIPRPLQLIIFLLFLVLFGFVLSFSLHLFGIHCNSAKEPMKVDFREISTNLRIIGYTADPFLTGDNLSLVDAHPDLEGETDQCFRYAKKIDETLGGETWESCINSSNTTGCSFLWLPRAECFNCSTVRSICLDPDLGGGIGAFLCNHQDRCTGDVYGNIDLEGFNFRCFGDPGDCSIPSGYTWNSSTGRLNCVNQDICGVNGTRQITKLDDKLKSVNAELLYNPNIDQGSYHRFVSVGCTNALNPELKLFGLIPLFNYQIWLIVMVIAALFMFMYKLR